MSMKNTVNDTLSVLEEKASKIKRPMNAFMLWSKQRRREISKNDPTIHNAQISKLLGEEWKVLPAEDKQPFLRESQKLMVKHKTDHPDYRYKPRKNKQEGGTRGIGQGKSCSLSTQGKPYSKYSAQHHYSGSRRGYYSNDIARMTPLPKHRPVVYYQSYGECHIPGCYECEYRRPYEHPRDTIYCCHNDIQKEYQSPKAHCLCCTPSPSFVPRSSSRTFSKTRSKSFTVESLMQEHQSSHCLKSPCSSPASSSPASTSPTREVQRGCRRHEESCSQRNGSISAESDVN